MTGTALSLELLLPVPGWPTLFSPQHFTLPAVVTAQAKKSPHETGDAFCAGDAASAPASGTAVPGPPSASRHGVRVDAADLDAMDAASAAVYRSARARAGVVGRVAGLVRSPL